MAGRNYSRKDSPTLSDLPLIWDSANSDWRLATLSNIKTLVESSLTFVEPPTTQRLIPLTGFEETLTGSSNLHLILTPAGTLATGTINLPSSVEAEDKQTVLVTTSQEITSLTVGGNGATVVGEPTTLVLGGFFTMKYDASTATWYRVG